VGHYEKKFRVISGDVFFDERHGTSQLFLIKGPKICSFFITKQSDNNSGQIQGTRTKTDALM
jgi:hypothetical protein